MVQSNLVHHTSKKMKDSYQKLADDVFAFDCKEGNSIFKQVKKEDFDEVKVALALQIVSLDCVDNLRVYPLEQKKQFYQQADKGCCGSINTQHKCLSGNIYWLGCNYGH